MLQDLAHLALWVWVQDKSRLTHGLTSKSVCVFCMKSTHPSHMPTKQNTNPPQKQWSRLVCYSQACLGWLNRPTLPQHHPLLWHYPLVPVWSHSLLLPLAPLLRMLRVGPPTPVLAQVPTSTACSCFPSTYLGVGPLTPAPLQSLGPSQATSTALLHPSYTVALAVTTSHAA